MYCTHCGKEIEDKAVFCVHCGVPTGELLTASAATDPADALPKKFPSVALVGVIFSAVAFFAAVFVDAFGVVLAVNLGPGGILSVWLAILAVSTAGLILGIIGISGLKKHRVAGLSIAAIVSGSLVFAMAFFSTVFWSWVYSIVSLV